MLAIPLIGGEFVCAVAASPPERNSATTQTILFIKLSPWRRFAAMFSTPEGNLYFAAATSSPLSLVFIQPCAAMDLMISFAVASAVFEA